MRVSRIWSTLFEYNSYTEFMWWNRRELSPEVLRAAYSQGIFPMGEDGEISWYRPRTRAIIPLDAFHVSRSLARTLRLARFEVSFDRDFAGIMNACAERKPTWITPKIKQAYQELHREGGAHSVEVRVDGELAGGLYGVHLGAAFFAESKFHKVTDMSKVALASLVRHLRARNFELLEVQYLTEHLEQFGTIEIPHKEYARILDAALKHDCHW